MKNSDILNTLHSREQQRNTEAEQNQITALKMENRRVEREMANAERQALRESQAAEIERERIECARLGKSLGSIILSWRIKKDSKRFLPRPRTARKSEVDH